MIRTIAANDGKVEIYNQDALVARLPRQSLAAILVRGIESSYGSEAEMRRELWNSGSGVKVDRDFAQQCHKDVA